MSDDQERNSESRWLTPMTEEKLREFVSDFVSGLIFSSWHLFIRNPDNPEEAANETKMVFMPIALGALSDLSQEDFGKIGIFWAYMRDAGPRSINGLPMFLSCHAMLKTDWERAAIAIEKEEKRRQEIEV